MAQRRHDSRVELIDWLSALGDVNRLRILRALEVEELSVGELSRIVQLPQSTVSRHLKMLLEARLVAKRSLGTASMYRLHADGIAPAATALWQTAREELARSRPFDAERARLAEVIAARHMDSRDFFGRLGGEWDRLRRELFGESFTSQSLLALIDPEWIIADLGCGTGEIAESLAPMVRRVIAVDREPSMLAAARKRLARYRNIDFREGDLLRLPLKRGEADAAVASLVMHHLDDPALAVVEIARVLRASAGGVLVIIDMVSHNREEYRHSMGHKHLGFSEGDVRAWARRAGFTSPRYLPLRPDTSAKGPGLFVASLRMTTAGA